MAEMKDERMTFVDLMALESLDSPSESKVENGTCIKRFMNINAIFNPGSGQAFGGHVYAQAVWAASQTVEPGMVVHASYFSDPVHPISFSNENEDHGVISYLLN